MSYSRNIIAAAAGLVLAIAAMSVDAQDNTLEEIVVVAQKREQNLQDVPIAVAAFTAEDIRELGSTQLEQLTEFIPAVELFDDRGAGQPTWVIRGVGLSDFNSNNTPTAAIYYDDFYLTSNVLGGIGLFDIARVEVLKGPQGGLYGRNTSGGAVLVLSRRPDLEDGSNGYVTADYGRWDRYGFRGAVGGSLGDNAAFRIAAMTQQGGGWQDSLATPQDDEYGDRDFMAARAQLTWEPSDTFSLWLKIEGGSDKSETTLGYSRALFDPNTGDFCAQAYAGSNDEQQCATLSNLTNLFVLTPGDPGILPGEQDTDGSAVMSKPINQLNNDWFGTELELSWDLESATLLSITGVLGYTNEQTYDFDAQELTLFEEDGRADLDLWSQEFRLVSDTDGKFAWLAGAMYAEDAVDDDRFGNLEENFLVFPGQIMRGFDQTTTSWSVYGQGAWEFSPSWTLSGALRYTDEEREYENGYVEDLVNGFFFYQDLYIKTTLDDHWSGDVTLEWTPTDDVMAYGKFTRGFKSGGFFGGFALSPEELSPYDEEIVYAYEVGFKTTWLDQTLRFNGALYYYDYQDVQGFTQEISEISGTVITRLGNLGDAEHKGIELEALWAPKGVDGLTLQLSGAWLDAVISDSDTISFDQAGTPFPIEGLQRGFAPEWSVYAQARYEWTLGDMPAAVQFNYNWRDNITDIYSLYSELDVAAFGHDAFGILNARASLGDPDNRWNIALIAHNILGEEYFTRASGDDLLSYPSTPGLPFSWGIEATYQW